MNTCLFYELLGSRQNQKIKKKEQSHLNQLFFFFSWGGKKKKALFFLFWKVVFWFQGDFLTSAFFLYHFL